MYAGDDTTDLSSATLDVGLGGAVHAEAKFTVGTFIDRREKIIDAGNVDKMMTILDRFQPMTTNLLKTVTGGTQLVASLFSLFQRSVAVAGLSTPCARRRYWRGIMSHNESRGLAVPGEGFCT